MTEADGRDANASLTEFAGDAEGGRLLRQSLSALLELDLEPSLRSGIQAVLRGDLSMRELSGHPGLRAIADDGVSRLRAELEELTPQERIELAAAARARAAMDPDR